MISREFDYHAPSTIEEAGALLAEFESDAAVIGGGTMLVPLMTLNRKKIRNVISLTAMKLNTVTLEDNHVCIGAMTSYTELLQSPIISDHVPLLRTMAEQITGGPSIQNQGTIGGSASYANPASDVPACLSALEAILELQSVYGARHVAARDFFRGAFRTAQRPNEFLARIRIPVFTGESVTDYVKHKFCTSSWPIVTVACVLHRCGEDVSVRVSVGAAATRPTFSTQTVGNAKANSLDSWITDFAYTVQASIEEGWTDELADAEYRRAIVPALVKRTLFVAFERMPS